MSNTPRDNQNQEPDNQKEKKPIQIEVDKFLENWGAYANRHSEEACILFADIGRLDGIQEGPSSNRRAGENRLAQSPG